VWSARLVGQSSDGCNPNGGHLPMVGCSPGTALELTEIQVQGKKRMSAPDFVNGYRPYDGELLGSIPSED
jgi:methionyl-tRNA formyltransferase